MPAGTGIQLSSMLDARTQVSRALPRTEGNAWSYPKIDTESTRCMIVPSKQLSPARYSVHWIIYSKHHGQIVVCNIPSSP